MANKHKKNVSTSLNIEYIQIKMTYTFSTLLLNRTSVRLIIHNDGRGECGKRDIHKR